MGVNLFFAISGLLICSRLLEEEDLNGRISLRGFYIRRAFRILPAAWMFLLVLYCLGLAGWLPLNGAGLIAAALMIGNLYSRAVGGRRFPTIPTTIGRCRLKSISISFFRPCWFL